MDNNTKKTEIILTPQCLYPLLYNLKTGKNSEDINYLQENMPLNKCGLLNNNYIPKLQEAPNKNSSDLEPIAIAKISFTLGLCNLPSNISTCLLPVYMKLNISVNRNLKRRKLSKIPLYERRSLCTNNSNESYMTSQYLVNNDSDTDSPNATNIKFIDQYRSEDMDKFYKACQKHRDQYRDPSGKKHPLDFFTQDKIAFQCPPDITSLYLKYPTYYTTYRHPIVLPRTFERSSGFVSLPERVLRGRYMKYSDFTYKR